MRNRSNLLVLIGIAFFVIGGIIVYVVTNGDDDGGSGSSSASEVPVVVATHDIARGADASEEIENGGLKIVNVPAGALVPGAIQGFDILRGGTIIQDFPEDAQIVSSGVQVVKRGYELPEGFEAIAVSLNFPQGVAGYVNPGDRVNLYGQFKSLDEQGAEIVNGEHAQLLMTNVRVLDVNQAIPAAGVPAEGTATSREGDGAVVMLLAVKTVDAERIVYMEEGQAIYATLVHENAAPAGPTDGANAGNILTLDPAASAA